MEEEIQKQLLTVSRKTLESMTGKTRIDLSMDENDINAYMKAELKRLVGNQTYKVRVELEPFY